MRGRVTVIMLVASCATRPPQRAAARPRGGDLGTIAGHVSATAPSGFFLDEAMPPETTAAGGVEVIATSPTLALPSRTVTAGDGMYRLEGLPPGTYEIRFRDRAGRWVHRDGVEVRGGSVTPVFVTLPAPEPALGPVCIYFGTCWT